MRIESIQFYNQEIQVLNYEGRPYVAMKSIVENIGLAWNAQIERIRRNKILNSTSRMIRSVADDGKNRELLCLPLGYLNGWLAGIDLNRVKPEIKPILELYQLECYDVLYNHFLPEVAAVHPNVITTEQQHDIKSLVNEVSRKSGIHYQGIYTRLYEKFKIPRYQELPSKDYSEAIGFLNSLVMPTERDEKKFAEQAFIVGVVRAGIQKRGEVTRSLDILEGELMDVLDVIKKETKKIYEIGRKIRHVNRSSGIIHDAMAEPYARFKFDKAVYVEGEKVAKKLSKPLNLEDWS